MGYKIYSKKKYIPGHSSDRLSVINGSPQSIYAASFPFGDEVYRLNLMFAVMSSFALLMFDPNTSDAIKLLNQISSGKAKLN